MPQHNRAELGRMATESGFVRDTFEKVLRLKEILIFLNEDEFLREHLLLKGGTAINLKNFEYPKREETDKRFLLFLLINEIEEIFLVIEDASIFRKTIARY